MRIERKHLMTLINELTSPDARIRSSASDRIQDWMDTFSSGDGRLLSEILAMAASCEPDRECLEAQLHALSELGTAEKIGDADLSPLKSIPAERLHVEHRDYMDLFPTSPARRAVAMTDGESP
ncbi:hypothetical protein SUDANB6_05353 [Streptomyces sp. enrichment culture]